MTFWFPNNKYQEFWFDGSQDHHIIETFSQLLKDCEDGKYDTCDDKLALMIVLDQLSRNIYRFSDFRKNDSRALSIAQEIINDNRDYDYPIHKRIFILLPFRHKRTTESLNFALNRLKTYESKDENDASLLKRFMKATLRDYAKVTDTIFCYQEKTETYPELSDVLDDNCIKYYDNDIFEAKRRLLENTNILNCDVCKAILNFVKYFSKKINIAVSLSGGVDSMVMLWIFYQLKIKDYINDVIAIHVNYDNRDASEDEYIFIKKWVSMFGIKLYYRKIEHVHRGDIDRDIYEEETRRIRFALYKYVIEKEDVDGVCLGHHKGDLTENVLMNIFRYRDLLELNRMSETMLIDGVNICRPMLSISKDSIYYVAHSYRIPYMKNTTPENSFRGILREKLLPILTEFDKSILDNINKIGNSSDEWSITINKMILRPIRSEITIIKNSIIIPLTKIYDLQFSLWEKLFIEMFHSNGHHMIGKKNLKTLIEWFKFRDPNVMFPLNNGMFCIKDTNYLYILNRNKLQKEDEFNIEFNHEPLSFNINYWLITIVPTTEMIRQRYNLHDVLTKKIEYTIPSDNLKLCYHLDRKNTDKKIFSRINWFSKYIPKVTSIGSTHKSYVKVTIEML